MHVTTGPNNPASGAIQAVQDRFRMSEAAKGSPTSSIWLRSSASMHLLFLITSEDEEEDMSGVEKDSWATAGPAPPGSREEMSADELRFRPTMTTWQWSVLLQFGVWHLPSWWGILTAQPPFWDACLVACMIGYQKPLHAPFRMKQQWNTKTPSNLRDQIACVVCRELLNRSRACSWNSIDRLKSGTSIGSSERFRWLGLAQQLPAKASKEKLSIWPGHLLEAGPTQTQVKTSLCDLQPDQAGRYTFFGVNPALLLGPLLTFSTQRWAWG